MKITDIKIHLAKEWRSFLFITIHTDEGIYGVGEAGLTGRELAVRGAIEQYRDLLIGEDASRIEYIWQRLWRCGFYAGGQVQAAAISAIDIALWDIKGKALGVPLYELFGGRVRDRLLTYCHVHGQSQDELLAHARACVDDGWKALRFEPRTKPGDIVEPRVSVDECIEDWAVLRESLGAEIELCYDAHTKLGFTDAVRLCRNVESFRPFFVEDPLRCENPELYANLRAQTATPLAAGEQYASKWIYKPVVEKRLIDFARIDVCIGGGLSEARKIAGWCETNQIDIAVHNPVGPVSSAACLHFNMAISNFGVMEMPKRPGETMAEVFDVDMTWADGFLAPGTKPGLGVSVNEEAFEKYPFELSHLPEVRRADGGIWNW